MEMHSRTATKSRLAGKKLGRMAIFCAIGLLCTVAALTSSFAQEAADTQLLKGSKVTEENLVDALTPPAEPVVTRSLKISRDGQGVSAPEHKPSASLLITFETNSSTLTASAKKQLDIVARALKNDRLADYHFNVEGHADPRGSSQVNLVLSQQRAESVRTYLISAHEISANRLVAEGKGDHNLLNRQIPSAPENRRVTIVTNPR